MLKPGATKPVEGEQVFETMWIFFLLHQSSLQSGTSIYELTSRACHLRPGVLGLLVQIRELSDSPPDIF